MIQIGDPRATQWMRIALEQADEAASVGEVPVGAVLVGPGGEIARAHNRSVGCNDPTAHAEINVLREAGHRLRNYRMPGTTLYVTLEPCMMCAGALIHARVRNLVFGVREPKGGAVADSWTETGGLITLEGSNHRLNVVEGVLRDECRLRLTEFFAARRK